MSDRNLRDPELEDSEESKPMLKDQMRELVTWVQEQIPTTTDHQKLCVETAYRFDLWDNNHFPIWLSRVIEGVLNDYPEKVI